jgi:hypothetical protein
MTWTTLGTIWLVCGVISAVWHAFTGNHMYRTLEYSTARMIIEFVIVMLLALIAGPIGLAIKIYEEFIDVV